MAVNCEKMVGDLFAAWTRLNVDEVMSHFAEDAVWATSRCPPRKANKRYVR
jgi:ketosteroid isomerase-like protein